MADLGQIIGTLLTSLAHARRMADEQTSAIAEFYRNDALLQGMTIPRIRVPELVVELPLLLEAIEEGTQATPADAARVQAEAVSELIAASKEAGAAVPPRLLDKWKPEVLERLTRLTEAARGEGATSRGVPRAEVVSEVERSLIRWLDTSGYGGKLEPKVRETLIARVRKRVSDVALKETGRPPVMKVSVLTSEVKNRADPQSVARVRLVMREEGLEWEDTRRPDGSTAVRLGPE